MKQAALLGWSNETSIGVNKIFAAPVQSVL